MANFTVDTDLLKEKAAKVFHFVAVEHRSEIIFGAIFLFFTFMLVCR